MKIKQKLSYRDRDIYNNIRYTGVNDDVYYHMRNTIIPWINTRFYSDVIQEAVLGKLLNE